jgi:hypothetical protein
MLLAFPLMVGLGLALLLVVLLAACSSASHATMLAVPECGVLASPRSASASG